MRRACTCALLLLLAAGQSHAVLRQLQRDWAALNMRSTTRHLMRPRTAQGKQECLALKTELRAREADGAFVVDAFAAAATAQSVDDETAPRGGLLGSRLPQGAVRCDRLDRACFTAPLGRIAGPLETEHGWHLVLVEERIGCRYDEGMARVVARPDTEGRTRSVLVAADSADGTTVSFPVFSFLAFVAFSLLGGRAIAELAALIEPIDMVQASSSIGIE